MSGGIAAPAVASDEQRLARIVTWLAAAIAAVIAVAVPLGFFWLTWQAEWRESAIAARLHAAFVTQVVAETGAAWETAVGGLIETELSTAGLPERRAIVAGDGRTVSASRPPLPAPLLRQSAPVATLDGVVAQVVVERSLRPVLWQTAAVSLLAAALGAATYLSLRLLPLRALRRTLAALRRQEAQSRERLEEELRVVLDNVVDGVLVVGEAGEVVSANRAAHRMLGRAGGALAGAPVASLLHPPPPHVSSEPFPLGQYETVARTGDGREFPVDLAVGELHGPGGLQRLGIVRDITDRKQNEARLSRMANYDGLTGLPNRSLFRARLQHAMARARRTGRAFALMFLDLDRFKNINDSLGHDVGDRLLVAVAKVLPSCVRDSDSVVLGGPEEAGTEVFRLGGDEFTILVEDLRDALPASAVARRILAALRRPFVIDEHELYISASIGITVFSNDGSDIDGLIKQADMAMYRSKALGRDTFYYFDEELHREATRRHQLEGRLRRALERGEFLLHYQPKCDLATGRITGVEALLRWQPGDGPLVSPEHFIPLLEETGLIVPAGAWTLRAACEQVIAWQREGMPPLALAVNLSARQFRQQDLLGQIAAVLRDTGLEPARLELELTESILIEDSDGVLQIMAGLGEMGVRIAIDDFGTGHSSMSYLKRFDVDTLKIDRSFVRDLPADADDSAIAIAVIALGHALRLKVVAEGVETPEQAAFLREQGCDEAQGYLLSRPLDAEAFARWHASHTTVAGAASPDRAGAPDALSSLAPRAGRGLG